MEIEKFVDLKGFYQRLCVYNIEDKRICDMTKNEIMELLTAAYCFEPQKCFNCKNFIRDKSASEGFRQFLLEHDFLPDGPIVATGNLVARCSVKGDKRGQKSGWYVFFEDDFAAGECGNWKTGEIYNWCAKEERSLSADERKIVQAQRERAKMARELERTRLAEEAALRADSRWEKAIECADHPYLTTKRIASHGLRVLAGRLLVPVRDTAGTMRSLQEIDASGNKMFLFGGAISGGFFEIPGQSGVAALCEGYATAASVHEATGWTAICAFNAGNLLPVGKAWREKHPDCRMIICGDDDRFTESGNVGRKKADECAASIGASAVYPVFASDDGKPTDWNDLHVRQGLQEVRRQLLAGSDSYKVSVADWVISPDMFTQKPEPRRDLVERTFPMGAVILLASLGGIGKSMKMLELALLVAGEDREPGMYDFNQEMFFGNRIMEHGPVVIFTAEDSHRDNCDRIYKIGRRFPKYPVHIVPIIDVAGAYPLILPGDKSGPLTSPLWNEMREQMLKIRPKLIVFDPLSSFAMLDLNRPEWATFAIGMFANLASETGACIIVTHHLAKTKDGISTPEQARALVRGSTAIVDRTRGTYVLWGASEKQGKAVCALLGEKWERDKVIEGCLAKENFGGDKSIKTFVRRENGLLAERSTDISRARKQDMPELMGALEEACAEAARRGQPFTKTGASGLYNRRQELPAAIKALGRQQLENLAQELLEKQRLVACITKGSTSKKWLDVPNGDFALGVGQIVQGATEELENAQNG